MRKLFEKKHDVDGIHAAIEAIAVFQGINDKMEEFHTETEVSITLENKVVIFLNYTCRNEHYENEGDSETSDLWFKIELKDCFDFEKLGLMLDEYWCLLKSKDSI